LGGYSSSSATVSGSKAQSLSMSKATQRYAGKPASNFSLSAEQSEDRAQ